VPGKIEGTVTAIGPGGNLVSDITREMLAAAPTDERVSIRCDEHETNGLFTSIADQPPMTLIAVTGQGGALELAIVGDSAAAMLGVRLGEKIAVCW
jgi:S-adenosylmethionine hydrolase